MSSPHPVTQMESAQPAMLRVSSGGDFRLGGWLVQPAQCRLSKDGRTVQVGAKVMDLLAYLASRQGQVVSKDDLLNDVRGSLGQRVRPHAHRQLGARLLPRLRGRGHHAPTRLYRADLADDRLSLGDEPEVPRVGDMALGVDISPSGHLAYTVLQRDTRFWRLDLADPGSGVHDAQLFESTLDEATPHDSPDGRRIAFASTRSGTQEIWIGDADGTGARPWRAASRCCSPQD